MKFKTICKYLLLLIFIFLILIIIKYIRRDDTRQIGGAEIEIETGTVLNSAQVESLLRDFENKYKIFKNDNQQLIAFINNGINNGSIDYKSLNDILVRNNEFLVVLKNIRVLENSIADKPLFSTILDKVSQAEAIINDSNAKIKLKLEEIIKSDNKTKVNNKIINENVNNDNDIINNNAAVAAVTSVSEDPNLWANQIPIIVPGQVISQIASPIVPNRFNNFAIESQAMTAAQTTMGAIEVRPDRINCLSSMQYFSPIRSPGYPDPQPVISGSY